MQVYILSGKIGLKKQNEALFKQQQGNIWWETSNRSHWLVSELFEYENANDE